MVLEKYNETLFSLPCVVDTINYEKQLVIDVIQHKDQMFKKGEELTYREWNVRVQKKLKDYPIQTDYNVNDRLNLRKVRYFCDKILNNE